MKILVALVGMKHRGTEELVASLPSGSPLRLKRDPTNPYDRNAIQVWHGDVHVGFIKKEQARSIAQHMDTEPKIAEANGLLKYDGGRWPMVEIVE